MVYGWKTLIPNLQDDIIPDILKSNLNKKFIQLYLIYISAISLLVNCTGWEGLPHYSAQDADLFQQAFGTLLIWECPILQDFWIEVPDILLTILNVPVPLLPELCLFGVADVLLTWPHYYRILLRETFFLARKTIALKWMDERSPRLSTWKMWLCMKNWCKFTENIQVKF